MRKTFILWVCVAVSLVIAFFSFEWRSFADPAYYLKRDTWQDTMVASREALRVKQREDEAKNPGARPFISEVVRGSDAPQSIKVSVKGWTDLYLIVTDDGDYHNDVANWAEAKLIGKEGKETYLDSVEPVSAKQDWGTFRRDNKSAVGGPMAIAQRTFPHGLGTHANSEIHYALKDDYDTFEASVGVDASRGPLGSIRFVVTNAPMEIKGVTFSTGLWDLVARDFNDPEARRQILWEQEDRIWEKEWSNASELGQRYAQVTRGALNPRALELAKGVGDSASLAGLREVYHLSREIDQAVAQVKAFNFKALRLAVRDLTKTFGSKYPKGSEYLRRLDELEKSSAELIANANKGSDGDLLVKTVRRLDTLSREALLSNPLLDFDRLVLVKRKDDNLGLPQNWQSNSSLPRSGFDNEIDVLSPVSQTGRLTTLYRPDGGKYVGDLDLHWEADRMLFSSLGANNRWQIFEIGAEGQALRQVTPGEQPDVDNYDACYLPDGRILFTSTACFVGVPCVYGSDHVTNLYRLEPDGKQIRQLTVEQDHDWCPTVLNNGRVLYLRWEYADTPHSQTRRLFNMNPDGTEQLACYGSSSYWPNGVFYARPLPNDPTKVVGIVSGHHGVPRMGELVIFDPAKGQREASGVVQRIPGYGKKVEAKIADAVVDGSWPKFLHPYPLSDKYFLVSGKPTPDSLWGIYLVDVFDNMQLIAEMPGHALLEPTPLRKTQRPPVIPDRVDPRRKDAEMYVADIYQGDGLKGIPRGTVKQLRLFTYHFAYQGMGGLLGVIGLDGPWDIKRVLGTVPVEEDGSARFTVPANTPLSLQPLDAEGKALQIMRSWATAMPGEKVSCTGCHQRNNASPINYKPKALNRPASQIKPWYGPTRGFSYAREVQPVLDKHCVSCHNGQPRQGGAALVDLRGDSKITDFGMVTPGNGGGNGGKFSVGYANLHRYVRRPGIESDCPVMMPMEFHADTTELVQLLSKGHHGVKLDPESWDRIITWIDLNAPYHGTWHEDIGDPGGQRDRRRQLRKLYAGMDDGDPETVPESDERRVASGEAKTVPGVREISNRKSEIENPRGWPFDASQAVKLQLSAAQSHQQTVDLGNGMKMDLVLVPAGEFVMGDANGCEDEQPLARVRIDKPFWMGRCEVTNEQFARFDPTHDSGVEDKLAYQFGVHGYPENEPRQPVVRVSWERAMEFCRWLSKKTGLKATLPTEAQWEYACRAGTATPFSYGDLDTDFSKLANFADAKLKDFTTNPYTVFEPLPNATPYDDYIPKETRFNDGGLVTASVGGYLPNAWGLFDMHGNAAEWTRTTYKPYPYDPADGRDKGDAAGRKVVRGGSWRDRPQYCRSAYRLSFPSFQGVHKVGFRILCEAAPGKLVVRRQSPESGAN
ncbi:MAG: SUMF1/EgtB/PvdO family nonheme iron enzyme [Armatimonadetes bacterium]|nr:SUMF1/EgtB/PvdO family nonheme iron enzyme [Armatimonadota bacterium]